MVWIKRVLINLALLITSCMIAVGVAEIALRLSGFVVKKDYIFPLYYYQAVDEAGIDLAKNFPSTKFCVDGNCFQVWTNEIGCFDKSVLNVKDNIMLVGDSFTWGYAPYEDIYGAGIEKMIGKRVIKCGVGGTGSKQQLLKAKSIHNHLSINNENKTELIILGYFWNDWVDDWTFPNNTVIDGYAVQSVRITDRKSGEKKVFSHSELQQKYQKLKAEKQSRIIKTWLTDNSVTYDYLRNITVLRKILSRFGMAKEKSSEHAVEFKHYSVPFYGNLAQLPSWTSLSWDNHMKNIRDIKQFANSINARLLVVLTPDKSAVYKYIYERAILKTDVNLTNIEQPHKILSDALRKAGIDYVDLIPEFRQYANQTPKKVLNFKKDLYYPYDPHLSPKGQRLTALLVSKYIARNNLIDMPKRRDIVLQQIEEKLKLYENK